MQVRSGAYQNMDEWRADMQLIWDNSRAYNGPEHPVTKQADKLAAALERRMSEAIEYAKAAVAAQDRGEPKPRTKAGAVGKGRSAELAALLGGSPFVTDSDSGDEQLLLGLTRAVGGGGGTFSRCSSVHMWCLHALGRGSGKRAACGGAVSELVAHHAVWLWSP